MKINPHIHIKNSLVNLIQPINKSYSYISVDSLSEKIFNDLKDKKTPNEIITSILSIYDVTETVVKNDFDNVINNLIMGGDNRI